MLLINNRFGVDPLRNEVKDGHTGSLTHLEPRLMKLLCLLAQSQGRVLSRSLLIKEVWQDYPGGEEGLTQAISALRKVLHDEQKQLIETLPKKGYCFHGTLTDSPPTADSLPVAKKKGSALFYLLGVFLLLVLAVVTLLYDQERKEIYSNQPSREESIRLSRMDSLMQAEKEKNN